MPSQGHDTSVYMVVANHVHHGSHELPQILGILGAMWRVDLRILPVTYV